MFAAVYIWKIKPGTEQEFRKHWIRGTEIVRDRCGAWGSRLHRAEDGSMVAYAHWPSKAERDRVWHDLPEEAKKEVKLMRALVVETLPELVLTVTDDLLEPHFERPAV